MASAVIYISSGRKFNFSKYIFDSLVRNVDSPSKFCMYSRFLQLMIRKQVGDLSTHTTKYTSLALSQKVFANMSRVGKGFSRVETPLFEGMLVAHEVAEEGDAEMHGEEVNTGDTAEGDVSAAYREVPIVAEEPSIPSPTPPTPPPQPSHDIPSTSQGRMIAKMDQDADVVLDEVKEVVEYAKVDESVDIQGRNAESQREIYKIDLDHANKRGLGGFMKYSFSNLEESKKCTWSSKGQGMEAIGILWCADHNIYNHTADFVSREEVPAHKIHSRSDVECLFNAAGERLSATKPKMMLLINAAETN
uniref:Uncharacterized protein n=1 Tax=Tanacetum cinerariifolium TaxID=118510 RepID=A0A6L2JLU1_TANCI|nr:hypothetical protein [Tanacetum cinerariifolium]